MRVLTHGLDSQLYQQQHPETKKTKDEDDEKKELEFYDETFKFHMAQIDLIESKMEVWAVMDRKNADVFIRLEVAYHTKFKTMLFKEYQINSIHSYTVVPIMQL